MESPEQKDARMKWWRESRFGMFIHWGLYAIPAGEWGDKTDYGEWIRHTAQIPIGVYDNFRTQFNPTKFHAAKWVQLAVDAGMRYLVITTKHHDGFAMYDSKVSDFDIMQTPYAKDVLAKLQRECDRQEIKLCFYHSIMDWRHPDYLPRREWETDRPENGADMNKYVQYLHAQVEELLTNYGEIGVMWFDGEWEETWNHEYGRALYEHCRRLQPNVIVNNRVDSGRDGMAGISGENCVGDFHTPEQEVPANDLPEMDWESCITMNDNWGYNRADKNYKSTEELLKTLADIASKGGNFLLNVGPDATGEIPHESERRLREIGKWMEINGESIYGTSAGKLSLPCGRSTMRDTTHYLHIFDWPENGVCIVPGLKSTPQKAILLHDRSDIPMHLTHNGLELQLPAAPPSQYHSVIKLEIR